MMLSLNDREWHEFYLKDIFTEIKRGKRLKKADHNEGSMPYVSSSAINNGVDNYISNKIGVRIFNNCLTIANSGSVGKTFYHSYSFIASDHVTQLKNPLFNHYIYKFLAPLISRLEEKYSFNREINDVRINKEVILLPTNENNKPDLAFMEKYIHERETNLIEQYRNNVVCVGNDSTTQLSETEWKEFRITQYFIPKRGRESNMADLKSGDIPLISAKNSNNGLKSFVIVPTDRVHKGHVITLNNDGDGGAGLAYYQPNDFALDSHVTSLRQKFELSKHTLIFISSAISKQRETFGHGYSISDKRLNKMKIMLPVSEKGEPNWNYMERYAKNMMNQQTSLYISYLNKKESVNVGEFSQ